MFDRRYLGDFLLPLVLLVAGTAFIAANGLDIALEQRFYQPGIGWMGREAEPWRTVYRFGVYPAYLLGGAGALVFLASLFQKGLRRYRKGALFLVLMLALGPGLLVNSVFKQHWGRPRPSNLALFNAPEQKPFHQVWERGNPSDGHSFPSGHSSAAFYLVAPYFVLRRRFRGAGRAVLAFGLCYGLFMGVARMAQGGHFASDVLWAGGVVFLSGSFLCWLLRLDQESAAEPAVQVQPATH